MCTESSDIYYYWNVRLYIVMCDDLGFCSTSTTPISSHLVLKGKVYSAPDTRLIFCDHE